MSDSLTLSSPAFSNGDDIPVRYTCDGDNISPPLEISGISDDAQALVLLMDDPDIPDEVKQSRGIEVFDHWVLFNLSPATGRIDEGEEMDITPGVNSAGGLTYTGPCPPKKLEPTEHRFFLKLFALDEPLSLEAGATKAEVEQAMKGHILQKTELMGRYGRE